MSGGNTLSHSAPQSGDARWIEQSEPLSLDEFSAGVDVQADALHSTTADILILPCNRELHAAVEGKNLFPSTTKDVRLALAAQQVASDLYDDSRERRDLVLKSGDVILPLLLFLREPAVVVGLNVLSNLIYDRWVREMPREVPRLRVEYATIASDGKTIATWRKVEGPADIVASLVREEAERLGGASTSQQTPSNATSQPVPTGPSTSADDRASRQGAAARETARALSDQAKEFLARKERDGAERLFRASLSKAREAVLWEPNEAGHRRFLHSLGKSVHDEFGCTLPFRDGAYWVSCPVLLSHTRGGFSIGGTSRTLCSICGEDMLTCPHERGNRYDGVFSRRVGSVCNICGKQPTCDHIEGVPHDGVEAFGVVILERLDHIALVEDPSNPLCAIEGHSLTKDELLRSLPEEERSLFVHGETRVSCHHCAGCTE